MKALGIYVITYVISIYVTRQNCSVPGTKGLIFSELHFKLITKSKGAKGQGF